MPVAICCPYRADGDRRDVLWRWCKARWEWMLPDALIVVADSGDEHFHRGKSINLAADAAVEQGATRLVLADTDTFAEPDKMQAALTRLDEQYKWSAPMSTYYNLDLETTERVLAGPVDIDWPRRLTYEHQITPVPTGIVCVRVDSFVGFNERFVGWGYEDNEFADRMRRAHGQVKLVTGACFHLWHPVDRSKTWEQPSIDHNRQLAESAHEAPLVYDPKYMREVRW